MLNIIKQDREEAVHALGIVTSLETRLATEQANTDEARDSATIQLKIGSEFKLFEIEYVACEDTKCECNEVNVGLAGGGVAINFFFNIETLQCRNKEQYTAEELEVIKAFTDFVKSPENDSYNQDFFKELYRETKAMTRLKAALKAYVPSAMVAYTSIFGPGEFLEAQNTGGKNYVVIDDYCVNPPCRCTEAGLHFVCVKRKKKTLKQDFSFVYDYFEKTVSKPTGLNDRQAQEIAASFTPEFSKKLGVRHARLKEAMGVVLLNAGLLPQRKKKVGRNELCPCGSGKKYKKCCLEKDEKTECNTAH